MTPHDEAAAMLGHYFRNLARAAGIRWTAQNDADMQRIADLLGEGGLPVEMPAFGTISTSAEDAAPTAHAPRPAQRPRPARPSGITPTTTASDDRTWMRNLAAANGLDTAKGGK